MEQNNAPIDDRLFLSKMERALSWCGQNSDWKRWGDCARLSYTMRAYYDATVALSDGNPESWSLMILGVLELWVVCDKAAVKICPLLREYNPGIPTEVETLLLPFRHQMERLFVVEGYVRERKSGSRHKPNMIFEAFGKAHSFQARFFDQSLEHQDLLEQIVDKATRERQKKRDELAEKKQ